MKNKKKTTTKFKSLSVKEDTIEHIRSIAKEHNINISGAVDMVAFFIAKYGDRISLKQLRSMDEETSMKNVLSRIESLFGVLTNNKREFLQPILNKVVALENDGFGKNKSNVSFSNKSFESLTKPKETNANVVDDAGATIHALKKEIDDLNKKLNEQHGYLKDIAYNLNTSMGVDKRRHYEITGVADNTINYLEKTKADDS